MTTPDVRVPPIPSGTLCAYLGATFRVYAPIWPGANWDGRYECVPVNMPRPTGVRALRWFATREELQVIEVSHG